MKGINFYKISPFGILRVGEDYYRFNLDEANGQPLLRVEFPENPAEERSIDEVGDEIKTTICTFYSKIEERGYR